MAQSRAKGSRLLYLLYYQFIFILGALDSISADGSTNWGSAMMLILNGTKVNKFPVRLWFRIVSGGLEPVLIKTEKSCIAISYGQFYTNIKIKNTRLKPVLLATREIWCI